MSDTQTPQPPSQAVRPSQAVPQPFDPRHKSPIMASILSVMPGLGQTYVGYYQRGFIHALVVASLIAILASDVLRDLTPLAAIFLAFFWLYNIVDAGRRAALFNQALVEGESFNPVALPDDALAPGPYGSLIGGTVLVLVGFVMLLHTRFDMRLDWIEDWWPVAPMVLGAYLIFLALQDRRKLTEATAE